MTFCHTPILVCHTVCIVWFSGCPMSLLLLHAFFLLYLLFFMLFFLLCCAGPPDAGTPHRHRQKKRKAATAQKWLAQLRLFQLAAIDQTERLWQVTPLLPFPSV